MIRISPDSTVNRIQRLLIVGCLALLWLGLTSRLKAAEERRPNIVILVADDWGNQGALFPGAAGVKTPAFDRIAKEGMLFRNAHSAAPSCSPSRAAMLTGQWPWRLEQGANLHGFIPPRFATYPEMLTEAGYVAGMEKKGYGPGSNEGRPHNAAGPTFKDFSSFLAVRPKGKPFCYWFGGHQPHRPYTAGTGVKSGIDPGQVTVPPYLPDNEITRRDICDYLQQIEQFDLRCAEVLALLEKSGQLDNTLIVVTGDNGWPFPRSKATCYDSGTHQLLAIRWGARIRGEPWSRIW